MRSFWHPIKVKEEKIYINDVTVTIYRLVPDYVVGQPLKLVAEIKELTLGVAY